MAANQLFTTLNNGVIMPLLGLGVYDVYGREAEQAIGYALETGYRLIDTAAMYRNEVEVGNAIRAGRIPRHELFVTTKVDNADQGYDTTLRAFDQSLKALSCDYVDLYLIHWPLKSSRKQTWNALEKLYAEGRVRAVGVANYLLPFLKELAGHATLVPAVNQIEFSPYLFLEEELTYCQTNHIVLQAYSPLIRGRRFDDPKLRQLAEQYGKTPAQILLRWALQLGVSTIPKSATPSRIRENFDVFDFSISADDMVRLRDFHENFRVVEDPIELL
ncbi:aldo/keto reductase [Nibrella viscosa]|uniref:Aldo/keto reductase n=1 Tax=Nibrella viscosa TaxID=1084524 RepID=A0ABP8KZ53_9BACT